MDIWLALEELMIKSLSRDGMVFVYGEALHKFRPSLIMRATDSLVDSLVKGESVVILTGFRVPPHYLQETDGPSGAAFLSRCLSLSGFRSYILIEEDPVSLNIMKGVLSSINVSGKVQVITLPTGGGGRSYCETIRLISDIEPSAAIFVEKPAPNHVGVYHSMRGLDISRYHIHVEPLMSWLSRSGTPTIGIGDGGNEVGMGIVRNSVRKYVPYGNLCNCPCRGGIASAVPTDYLVISGTSNLGAYALSAGIFLRNGVRECLISYEIVREMLISSINAGAVDGVKGYGDLSVDGYSVYTIRVLIKELRDAMKFKA